MWKSDSRADFCLGVWVKSPAVTQLQDIIQEPHFVNSIDTCSSVNSMSGKENQGRVPPAAGASKVPFTREPKANTSAKLPQSDPGVGTASSKASPKKAAVDCS